MAKYFDEILNNCLQQNQNWKKTNKDSVTFEEVIELFVNTTVYSIQREEEIPKFNIVFGKDAFLLFEELLKNPFKKEGFYTPNIRIEDIENLRISNQSDYSCPTIFIKNHENFFKLLTDIINEQVDLNSIYHEDSSARRIALLLMRRIWLRMGENDFENVEHFLQKQLDFLKNREFDDSPYQEKYLKNYMGHDITYGIEKCETWCETSRRMHFRIYDSNKYHDLPNIYYDIREEDNQKVCYIYAVQMPQQRTRIKSIERKLYKLNEGILSSKVHPNFVMAMNLFCEMLESKNITHIKVPLSQVLDYRYHVLLSKKVKQDFERKWNNEELAYMEELKMMNNEYSLQEYSKLIWKYEIDKIWYDRVVDKADFIQKAKTEGLVNLCLHMESMNKIKICQSNEKEILDIDIRLEKDNKFCKRKEKKHV